MLGHPRHAQAHSQKPSRASLTRSSIIKKAMTTKFQSLASWTVAVLLTSTLAPIPVQAQSERIRDISEGSEDPANTTRVAEIPEFGISVTIPENYRTMKFEDGSVQVMPPNVYRWFQCLASGGVAYHGYYFEEIQQVAPASSMSLRAQISEIAGNSSSADMMVYQQNGLDGYVAAYPDGWGAVFLGKVPGSDQLLQVSTGCDCEVGVESVLELLSRFGPLAQQQQESLSLVTLTVDLR